jgi:hypothetical protein
MKLKNFLIIASVVPALFGLSLLFSPASLMQTNGLAVSGSAIVFAQGVGGLLIGLAVINWYAKKDTDSPIIKGVLIGNILVHLIALVTDAMAISQHVITKNPAFSLVVHGVFVLAFGYYFLNKKHTQTA